MKYLLELFTNHHKTSFGIVGNEKLINSFIKDLFIRLILNNLKYGVVRLKYSNDMISAIINERRYPFNPK